MQDALLHSIRRETHQKLFESESYQQGMGTLAMLQEEEPEAFDAVMAAKQAYFQANMRNTDTQSVAIKNEAAQESGIKAYAQQDERDEKTLADAIKDATGKILLPIQQEKLIHTVMMSAKMDYYPIKMTEARLNGGKPLNGLRGILEEGPKAPADRGNENSASCDITR